MANDVCEGRSSVVFNRLPSIVNSNNDFPTFNGAWEVGTVSYLFSEAVTQFLTADSGRAVQRVNQPSFPEFCSMATQVELPLPSALKAHVHQCVTKHQRELESSF